MSSYETYAYSPHITGMHSIITVIIVVLFILSDDNSVVALSPDTVVPSSDLVSSSSYILAYNTMHNLVNKNIKILDNNKIILVNIFSLQLLMVLCLGSRKRSGRGSWHCQSAECC